MADPSALADRIAELAAEVDRHRDLYYRGVPEIPDADFDALERELAALVAAHPDLAPADNPLERPGAPKQLQGSTIRHARPMLSLEKATTSEHLHAFCVRFAGQPLRVTPKLDGVSLSVVYRDGELEHAATRGNGEEGELVTDKVLHVVPELPRRLGADAAGRVEVRGEAVMLRSTFAAYNEAHPDKPLVNPRNGAAGTLVHKDPAAAAADGRVLTFFAFDADRDGEVLPFDLVASWGFGVPEVVVTPEPAEAEAAIEAIGARRDELDFDIDGAVVRLHEARAFAAAGSTSAAPRGAIAWKFPPEERSTKLVAVTWAVGKVGRIAPRAELEPVFVGGTTVTYATLHNPKLIAERDIRIGDTVIVRRAGDVIPFVAGPIVAERDGSERPVEVPSACPSCGEELEVRGTGEERWCVNLQCPAQAVRRLIHWSSRAAADMEGVGSTWIEKWAESGLLRRPSDFYALTEEQLLEYEGMGPVMAGKVLAAIEGSKGVGMRRALIGMAVPGASEGTSKRLAQHGFASVEQVAAASAEQLAAVKDIGPKVAEGIVAHFARADVREEIAALRAHGVSLDVRDEDRPVDVAAAAETPLKGATVVVTGTIRHPDSGEKIARPDFVRRLEAAGATNASSVSGQTTFLITGEDVGASKTAKAEKLEVRVVDQGEAWGWLAEAGV